MFNFLDKVKENPAFYKQISIDGQLVTEFNCPIETRQANIWSHKSYFVYVVEGKKTWHTADKAFELTQGKCVFVKQGAHIIEQFFDTPFCVIIFFVSDEFIAETIRTGIPHHQLVSATPPSSSITNVCADDFLHAFFNSVIPYFLNHQGSNKTLLELKLRELILNVIFNPKNQVLKEYFYSLHTNKSSVDLRKIMEENFFYNLHIEEFAKMCNRSLSAFKRDFFKQFNTTPGRWLLQRRLNHSQILIKTSEKSISEIAYDCGFENTSHFSKAFRRMYGNSPVKYRENTL